MSVASLLNAIIGDQRTRITELEFDRVVLMAHMRTAIGLLAKDYPITTEAWQERLNLLIAADDARFNALKEFDHVLLTKTPNPSGADQAPDERPAAGADNGTGTGPASASGQETAGAAPRIALLQRQSE